MKRGDWVVQIRGKYSGRVGRVERVHKKWHPPVAVVQFGADGPFEQLAFTSLRLATRDELADWMKK